MRKLRDEFILQLLLQPPLLDQGRQKAGKKGEGIKAGSNSETRTS